MDLATSLTTVNVGLNSTGLSIALYRWLLHPYLKPTNSVLNKVDSKKDELVDQLFQYRSIIATQGLKDLESEYLGIEESSQKIRDKVEKSWNPYSARWEASRLNKQVKKAVLSARKESNSGKSNVIEEEIQRRRDAPAILGTIPPSKLTTVEKVDEIHATLRRRRSQGQMEDAKVDTPPQVKGKGKEKAGPAKMPDDPFDDPGVNIVTPPETPPKRAPPPKLLKKNPPPKTQSAQNLKALPPAPGDLELKRMV